MSYFLKTGDEGAARLDSVQALYGEESFNFLETIGIEPGSRIVDAGCGTGNMTAWFASKVGGHGEVIAVDQSAEQLVFTEKKLAEQNITNVSFVCKDIQKLTPADVGVVDVYYTRLVLAHIHSPLEFIKQIKNIAAAHTLIVFEESITADSVCFPPSAAFDKHLQLYQELARRTGSDFNIGDQLIELMAKAGIKLERIRKVQRVLNSELAKRIAYGRTLECADGYLEHDLIDKKQLDELLVELKALTIKEDQFISGVMMTQACGRFK